MSNWKQATNKSPSIDGGAPLYYCHTCQKNFANADGLRMHCRSSKAHRNKRRPQVSLAPSSLPSSSPTKRKTFNCDICNKQFVSKSALRNHKKDSQNHRNRANARSKDSQRNGSKAGPEPEPEANGTASGMNLADIEEPEELVDYYYHYLEDHLWTVALPAQLPLSAPPPGFRSSFLNDDTDFRISLTSALQVAQQYVYDLPVRPSALVPSLSFETYRDLDDGDTNAESYASSVPQSAPPVPGPWSSISLSDRYEVLAALKAQCHSLECLEKEGYWTQTPSAVDIEMTRKCRDCGDTKDAEHSVCRFHPARKAFQQGIIRGRGPSVPKKAGCINCTQPGSSNSKSNSKGCILLSSHTFAPPTAKLSNIKATPLPVPYKSTRAAIVLDCEMVGVLETTPGSYSREQSEVIRVVAVDFLTGEVLLDTYVSPLGRVISWRTKYSGVNASILAQKKREGRVLSGGWTAAREALYRFIDADTVLIGHGLNNDLAVLGMVHTRVVDSAILTRVAVGEDCQRHWKLRTLVKEFLGLSIQAGDGKDGHDCVEDTFAAREVLLWCLLNEDRLQEWAAGERAIIEGKQTKPSKKASVADGEGINVPT
ncbi:hypothetical protein BDV19DRAFT_397534 [Aspergillus venezuelensis]